MKESANSIHSFAGDKQKRLVQAARWASRQERSKSEMERKLISLGAGNDEVKEILAYLESEGYIDEQRYARAFTMDKYRFNHWGRMRIRAELKSRRVPEAMIREALQQITEPEYTETLERLLRSRMKEYGLRSPGVLMAKLTTFAIRKGYEPDLVFERVRAIIEDKN